MITYIFNRNDIVISSDYPESEVLIDVFREKSVFLTTQNSDSCHIFRHGLNVPLIGVVLQAWPTVLDAYPQMIVTYDKYVCVFTGHEALILKTDPTAQVLYDAYHEFLVSLKLKYPKTYLLLNNDYGYTMGLVFQQQPYHSIPSTFHPLRCWYRIIKLRAACFHLYNKGMCISFIVWLIFNLTARNILID